MNKTIGLTFFKEVKDELKKVIWPTKKDTIGLTSVVLIASVIVGLFIGGIDFLFTKIFSLILKI